MYAITQVYTLKYGNLHINKYTLIFKHSELLNAFLVVIVLITM